MAKVAEGEGFEPPCRLNEAGCSIIFALAEIPLDFSRKGRIARRMYTGAETRPDQDKMASRDCGAWCGARASLAGPGDGALP